MCVCQVVIQRKCANFGPLTVTTMYRISVFILLFIACTTSCKKKPEDAIADAKKKTAEINGKLKDYRLKQVDDIVTPGRGNISGYYRDDEIKKIYAEHYSDTNRSFTSYYFDDGMLIFVTEENYKYNRPTTYTEEKALAEHDSVWYDDKKTKLEVSKLYLYKNTLIKWTLPDGKDMPVNIMEFINKEPEVWANAAILLKELNEQ